MSKLYYIYILANKKNGTLYTGVTNDLIRRIYEHKNDLINGFTKRYQAHILVYYETSDSIDNAILREKYLKGKSRRFKISLIEKNNPKWLDLWTNIIG